MTNCFVGNECDGELNLKWNVEGLYNTQNHWVCGLCPSSGILNN
jgi:hypothetical protein